VLRNRLAFDRADFDAERAAGAVLRRDLQRVAKRLEAFSADAARAIVFTPVVITSCIRISSSKGHIADVARRPRWSVASSRSSTWWVKTI
jgi:hypothetical protein